MLTVRRPRQKLLVSGMNSGVQIRKATKDDAEIIADILRRAIAGFASDYSPEAFVIEIIGKKILLTISGRNARPQSF